MRGEGASTAWSSLIASLAGVATTLSVSAATAAEWTLSPNYRASMTYTDNPRFLVDGGTSSAGAVGEAGFELRRATERLDLTLQPLLSLVRYQDDATLDSENAYVQAGMKYVGERSEWTGAVNLTRDTTLTSELGSTGFVETNRRHESYSVSLGPNVALTERLSAGAQGYYSASCYPDSSGTIGLVDYNYRALSLFLDAGASELSRLRLSAQGGELVVPDQNERTRDATLRLSWSRQWAPLWTTSISAGPAYVDSEAGSDNDIVFSLNARRHGERWTLDTNVGRSFAPTGRGVLTRKDEMSLGARRYFTERLSGGLTARWIRNQDLLPQAGIQYYEVEYQRVDVDVSWRFAEQWSLSLVTGAATQRQDQRDGTAENYRAGLSLVWNGRILPL